MVGCTQWKIYYENSERLSCHRVVEVAMFSLLTERLPNSRLMQHAYYFLGRPWFSLRPSFSY